MYQLILRGARLGDEVLDIGVEDGRVGRIAARIDERAEREIEAQGRLVSPPFIESHVHLDTTLTAGEPRWNESGTLFEGIQIWSERKKTLSHEDVVARATQLLKWQAAQGVLHVRTHADVTDPDFTGLKALLEVKEKVREWVDVQIVAFPQEGMLSYPKGVALMEEALMLGADVVGGIPHYEHTREMGVESVKESFRLAEKHDKPIDIHCDETDDPHSRFLEVMAAEAIRTGMGPRVTASHTTAFGSYDNAYAFKLMGFLSKADINFVANPLINITLQGRYDTYPKRRGITRVKELWQNGLNVYSTSVSALAVDINVRRHVLTIAVGVFATAFTIYLVFAGTLAEQLDAWLATVVAWASPWAAIMLVHYYIIKRENIDVEALYQSPSESRVGDVNWAAILCLVIGLVMTWLFLYGLVAPLQGPIARALNGLDLSWLAGMLTAGLLYYALYRLGMVTPRTGAREEVGELSRVDRSTKA